MRTNLVKTRRDGNRDDCVFPIICGDSCQHCQDSAGFPVRISPGLRIFRLPFAPAIRKNLARRQVRRLKGKLGRGVRGLRSKRLGRAPCACRNKLPICQIIGSFHQIEEPNKEEKRVRLMTHSVDLGLRFGANKSDQQSGRKPSLRDENLPISGRSLLVLCRVWKSFSLYSFFAARFSWFQRFPLPLLSRFHVE